MTTSPLIMSGSELGNGYGSVNAFAVVKGPGGARGFVEFLGDVFGGRETPEAHADDTDGLVIHAEVRIGDSCLMIADSKPDWVFTPALLQVNVTDCDEVLRRAKALGAQVITQTTPFYGASSLARFIDPWSNVWWLFGPAIAGAPEPVWDPESTGEESTVHATICQALRELKPPQ
ncbi:bleomycin resistance protein [Nocardia flavorosea]|uniref:Bleomycin resistance protein n=1 Tax=Nocardia flavorosea TaxID=53429 RepID=A0A846YCY7_9NOCA|nr:bleomycin resistance protein [Nocardia flavorosea]NKY55681.1 bleomycin resistance protein [Nocardia flavorosea]